MARNNGMTSAGKRIMQPLVIGRLKDKVKRLTEIKALAIQARALADDGNWPQCYAEDVTFLLRIVNQLQKACTLTKTPDARCM